jgi:2-keto-3-deoxy-L-rhamnonate aldolase RhmA
LRCHLKDRLKDGETLLGTWVTIGHTDVPDIMEALGFDWIVLDSEHAPLGPEALSSMIQAVDDTRVCPMVRVGAIDQYLVKSSLDMGAHGIVFPLVNSAEQARAAVSYTKYPPDGVRGVAPRKAADYGLSFEDYVKSANEMTVVVAQVETAEAVSRIDEILSTSGIDVAFVGPTDLTYSMGLLGDRSNTRVLEAMRSVVRACGRHDRVPGVLAATPGEARRDVELGFRFVGLGSDTRFMISGAREFIASVRGPGQV